MNAKKKPTGRRPGKSSSRESIVQSARAQFARKGYDRTTIREIAELSKVDPALVIHYFGSKQELFLATMLPLLKVPKLLPQVFVGDPAQIGQRYAALVRQLLEDKETPQFLTALIRAASSEPKAAELLRSFLKPQALQPVASHLQHEKSELVASLIGAQLIGIIFVRYIVGLEPLAKASPADIEKILAPIIQDYFELQTF